MCPICTVGVAAGVGLSRWLKVDDVISGIWAGALILAVAIWTFKWIAKRLNLSNFWKIVFFAIILIAWWLITFLPLHYSGWLDSNCQKILGLNRLLFGSFAGLIVSGLALGLENMIRRKRGGKAMFHFQKVVLPLAALLIISFIAAWAC